MKVFINQCFPLSNMRLRKILFRKIRKIGTRLSSDVSGKNYFVGMNTAEGVKLGDVQDCNVAPIPNACKSEKFDMASFLLI